jgi:subtilase family serine protease
MLKEFGLKLSSSRLFFALFALALTGHAAFGQMVRTATPSPASPTAGGQTRDSNAEAGLVTLPGNVPAVARIGRFDRGRVSPELALGHMELQLKRSAETEKALDELLADLQNPASPNYQHWMTASQFGFRFGASEADVELVTEWLRSNGLTVEGLDEARMAIQFSGTAGQVEDALHTEIHNLSVGGRTHIAAVVEPQVPESLAGLIVGVPLSDFQPHPMHHDMRSMKLNPKTGKFAPVGPEIQGADPSFAVNDSGNELELVAPGDFAKIYNLTAVWNAGYRGKGQTIAVVEDTLMKAADVVSFRNAFGLSGYAGTFVQEAPVGAHPCANPGIVASSEGEGALDAEWAGATAPDAAIVLAGCADTRTQFGGLIAVQNLLSQKTPPQVISMSYGYCEGELGAINLNQYATTFQQAVAEGVSIFVSSGDEGAASCDADEAYAVSGITTSGFATTPYNVAVGGTDFYDFIQGTTSEYWSKTNSSTYTSALSYVPEKSWNDSCADSDLLGYVGSETAYGANGFCNSSTGLRFVNTSSGSGGPSSVYLKPSWQNVYGVPTDGVRDVPDVSLFSSNGFWGHGLVYCNSDIHSKGTPCTYTSVADTVMNYAGGTSFASPALAGIFALITQKYGRQGNPDPGFYALAAKEYGTQDSPESATLTACNATQGKAIKSTCTYHDVTKGSIDVPCIAANCFGWSLDSSGNAIFGALSASTAEFSAAYPTTIGWDFATGLGSVNALNLLTNWSTVKTAVVK